MQPRVAFCRLHGYRGVDVRFIYDSYGSTDDEAFWNRVKEAGIELHCFNPPDPTRNLEFSRYDVRDHRKIVIVDGRVACHFQNWF